MPRSRPPAPTDDPLAGFSAATRAWFEDSFAEPTRAQRLAWAAIGAGEHALVIAPTGSGKTLAAFLSALDRLISTPGQGTRVLYVSPLKALGVDVERNLRAPLQGITRAAERLGEPAVSVRTAIRSGDTAASERRRLISRPPDILITTPESLFLMLTSQARETLRTVEVVILDEIHVLAGSKRGAHLSLSLERLQELTGSAPQRIGLSATVRPPDRVARFLAGDAPVRIVTPESAKQWDLGIRVPVEEYGEDTVWPALEGEILDIVQAHRSTIVFANSRRVAERLTAHLNEQHAERLGLSPEDPVPVLARAHHGSVAKEQRAHTEAELKAGRLPCVVATSSLELGIDMGAVDVVVQVASPPSVASGLQRIGRAGHQVGAVSTGVFLPTHRGDLIETVVVADRMRAGRIEEIAELHNPLDVLAQQLVAMVAMEDWEVDRAYALVRRSAQFATLTRALFEAVVDMLAGRYPAEDFGELRPRLVWDRSTGVLRARPGAARLAVTSGGTIPDRGLFGVFLAGDGPARRVGELDEEMVYESRVGDVFALGTSTWRIEEITHDQVRVSPAPGVPAKLPFWHGDQQGRPAELGEAFGAFVRAYDPAAELPGLDASARTNLTAYLAEQRAATGVLPTDTTIVLERFRDELGDWRVCVHSALGSPVLAAWALAIERRARERYGSQAQATATNDGIILRIPDTESAPPGVELISFTAEEITTEILAELGGSALFAARFRECAARALLLPKRDPRRRAPLWQQRMRSAQLLAVAARFPEFPIMLETTRECLHDVFDLPGLTRVLDAVAQRRTALVEVETATPSPFAKSLLFSYIGEFIYNADSPLAEQRAAGLNLDSGLLAELLGIDGAAQLLDADVVAEVEAELQARTEHRRARAPEQVVELIRTIGPLSAAEVAERCTEIDPAATVAALIAERRIAEVRIAGTPRYAVVEDLARLRDGLGVPVPPGFAAEASGSAEPIRDLVLRWGRCHGPFAARDVAARYGLGVAVVERTLGDLIQDGTLVRGDFTQLRAGARQVDARVLSLIKRRTLARLRRAVEPVDQAQYAAFLTQWQSVTGPATEPELVGFDGVLTAVEQLAGYPIPASMLETIVLPCRVAAYAPTLLDELLASGEVTWSGAGALGEGDGWVRLWPGDLVPDLDPEVELSPAATELATALGAGGGWFLSDLLTRVETTRSTADWEAALWELIWAGRIRSDTFAPVRSRVTAGVVRTPRRPRPRRRSGMLRVPHRVPATTTGRWSLIEPTSPEQAFTERLLVQLDRHGVLTRGAVLSERPDESFSATYRALSRLEEAGQCLRGYFIDGLGAAQFATAATVDRLRAVERGGTVVLAATDPANPYGAALGWPPREGHRPGRKPGALVVLTDGDLAVYLERGGHTMLTFTDEQPLLRRALEALAGGVRRGWFGAGLTIERCNGEPILGPAGAEVGELLTGTGFSMTPQGYRLRA
ncbi:DEAD/DEAH box helicase [Granulicoccus phenolivorans]|uniref:DEAD/DEAH box helicase n=1 Tax=Granulicoccus phenolivorans TaxID=266854 RepID=UPI0003F4C3E9|nr:DEAD/DEAH box helicase [Granulicoccus phenolivorans]